MRESQSNAKKKEENTVERKKMNSGTPERRERERTLVLRYSDRSTFLWKNLSFACYTSNLISVFERCAIWCYFEQGH